MSSWALRWSASVLGERRLPSRVRRASRRARRRERGPSPWPGRRVVAWRPSSGRPWPSAAGRLSGTRRRRLRLVRSGAGGARPSRLGRPAGRERTEPAPGPGRLRCASSRAPRSGPAGRRAGRRRRPLPGRAGRASARSPSASPRSRPWLSWRRRAPGAPSGCPSTSAAASSSSTSKPACVRAALASAASVLASFSRASACSSSRSRLSALAFFCSLDEAGLLELLLRGPCGGLGLLEPRLDRVESGLLALRDRLHRLGADGAGVAGLEALAEGEGGVLAVRLLLLGSRGALRCSRASASAFSSPGRAFSSCGDGAPARRRGPFACRRRPSRPRPRPWSRVTSCSARGFAARRAVWRASSKPCASFCASSFSSSASSAFPRLAGAVEGGLRRPRGASLRLRGPSRGSPAPSSGRAACWARVAASARDWSDASACRAPVSAAFSSRLLLLERLRRGAREVGLELALDEVGLGSARPRSSGWRAAASARRRRGSGAPPGSCAAPSARPSGTRRTGPAGGRRSA